MSGKPTPIWVQFRQGKVRAFLLQRGAFVSLVRYAENFGAKVAHGDEQRVLTVLVSARHE